MSNVHPFNPRAKQRNLENAIEVSQTILPLISVYKLAFDLKHKEGDLDASWHMKNKADSYFESGHDAVGFDRVECETYGKYILPAHPEYRSL